MKQFFQNDMSKIIPYDLNTVLNQIYQYKCFETNLNRALFLKDQKLQSVCLINNYWFNHWKKVSCYQIMKNEIDLNIQNNNMTILSNGLANIFQNINSVENFEPLDQKIDNEDIKTENINNPNQICVDWESEFDIISPELWNLFAPNGSINQNTNINLNLEFLSNDSRVINISDKACYIIFWNNTKQKLGKFIFKFDDETSKNIFIESMKQSSFNQFYKGNLSDIQEDNDKIIQYAEVCRIKCLNKTEVNLPVKNPNKSPLGLTNVRMTCYMNSALQSLFNIKKLTNYLLNLKHAILTTDMSLPLLKAYMKTILNLSRKAEGSRKLTEYAPNEFFNTIKNESEFVELAGDSYDVVRHFFQKMHEQLMPIKQDESSIFSKLIISNPNCANGLSNIDIQNLNNTINKYAASNRTIIANLFYYMERSITQCSCCQFNTSNFNVQMSIIFSLEEVRQWKFSNQLISMINQCNNNTMNNTNNMGMNNNNNMMMNNMNNNMNNNNMNNNMANNNINMNNTNNNMNANNMNNTNNIMNNNTNNNMSMNNMNNNVNMNNMNNNMNNMNNNMNMNNMNNNVNMNNNNMPMNNNNMCMNNGNNMGMINNMNSNNNQMPRNLNGGMFNGNIGNSMGMGNNFNNTNNANFQNMNGMPNNMPNMNNMPMNSNTNAISNPNMNGMVPNNVGINNNIMINNNFMMNNNMMMANNMMMDPITMIQQIKTMPFENLKNFYANYPQPQSVDLMEAFEHYKKENFLMGQNKLYCQNCKNTCDHMQSNHFYTLPEYLVINLNRGKANMYQVGVTFPETLDLTNEVQVNFGNSKYRLICIITHLGPHGTGGHYIAFCFLQDKNMWYKFDDRLVTESSFMEASKFGDTYILFYQRM